VLDPSIDRVNVCTGTWKENEDSMPLAAVQKKARWQELPGLPQWFRIEQNSSVVKQIHNAFDPSTYQLPGRTGK
jgi:hypothetical protein